MEGGYHVEYYKAHELKQNYDVIKGYKIRSIQVGDGTGVLF